MKNILFETFHSFDQFDLLKIEIIIIPIFLSIFFLRIQSNKPDKKKFLILILWLPNN